MGLFDDCTDLRVRNLPGGLTGVYYNLCVPLLGMRCFGILFDDRSLVNSFPPEFSIGCSNSQINGHIEYHLQCNGSGQFL